MIRRSPDPNAFMATTARAAVIPWEPDPPIRRPQQSAWYRIQIGRRKVALSRQGCRESHTILVRIGSEGRHGQATTDPRVGDLAPPLAFDDGVIGAVREEGLQNAEV